METPPCHSIALALLAHRGWLLGDQVALARSICLELADMNAPKMVIERATIRHYCRILYAACGDRNSSQQRRAFTELWTALFSLAKQKVTRDPDLAEDLAQQALAKTFKNLGKCKDPGSFLNFAALILINEIRDYYRKTFRNRGKLGEENWVKIEVSESELSEFGSEYNFAHSRAGADEPGEADVGHRLDGESRKEFHATLRRCVENQKHRRVLEELLKDRGYKEIAESLAMSVGNVYVCRNRAIQALRKCQAFLRFLEERLL